MISHSASEPAISAMIFAIPECPLLSMSMEMTPLPSLQGIEHVIDPCCLFLEVGHKACMAGTQSEHASNDGVACRVNRTVPKFIRGRRHFPVSFPKMKDMSLGRFPRVELADGTILAHVLPLRRE
jgi:hypothetical protein